MEKVYINNSYKDLQLKEKVANSERKRKFLSRVSSTLYNFLTSNKHKAKILSMEEKLAGTILFNGIVKVAVSLDQGRITKKLDIPVSIKNSNIELPSIDILNKKIASIQGVNEYKLRAQKLAFPIIKQIEKNAEAKSWATPFKPIPKAVDVSKVKDVEEKTNHTYHYFDKVTPVKILNMVKSDLPNSLKLNDILLFNGLKYKIVSEDTKQNNWILELQDMR
jgi:hypothetical protein